MEEIKLYGYSTSPFVRKVGCCLYYKQIPFTFVPVNPIHSKEIAFTNQTQVPVLQIDDEWRKDSTPIALWLDERFPENPLFGNSTQERERILEIDRWVTDSVILGGFRSVHEGKLNTKFRHMAWRLAAIVSSQTPLPEEVRNEWPHLLKSAPFIKAMMEDVDPAESLSDMRGRIAMELFQQFAGGPFFGGREQPSLADFALFPQLVFSYMVGIEEKLLISFEPSLNGWLKRMQACLPENPILVPDFMIVHNLD